MPMVDARVSWNELVKAVRHYRPQAIRTIEKDHPEYGKILDVGVSIRAHDGDLYISYVTQHVEEGCQGYWSIAYA